MLNFTFQVNSGYNKLLLSYPVRVFRGNLIMVRQSTGKIAVDTSGTASYSDLVWNTTTQWTKLAEYSNWRFYLNVLNNFTSYQSVLNILHVYSFTGSYNVSIYFNSSGQIFYQAVQITDCN